MAINRELEVRAVAVTAVNDHGIKIADGSWLNVSKFADADDVALPAVGDRVVVHLDSKGFIRRIDPPAPIAPKNPAGANSGVKQPSGAAAATSDTFAPASEPAEPRALPDKDMLTTRMNVLATATTILAAGGRAVDPAEVVKLAVQLESWVNR